MRVLQQAGDRMPYKAENWETVLGGGWARRVRQGQEAAQ